VTDPAVPPPAAPTPAYAAAPAAVPGKTLGIVGLVLDFIFPLLGLILSIVAQSQSKAAGVPNTPAKVGVILGIVFIALGIIFSIIGIAVGAMNANVSTY
jgi:preprotein translocase subunit SecG